MLIMDSLSLNKTARRPVWIMRQAGRYMSSFRAVRKQYSFQQICDDADLATQVSLLPMKQYALDASIVFSDILIPWQKLGVEVDFSSEGPQLKRPEQETDLLSVIRPFDPYEMTPVILKTITQLRAEISKEKAMLGFAGAPFTMLCYFLEGKMSKDLSRTKQWLAMYPSAVHKVLDFLSTILGSYLEAQVESGADAVQLFDTWASALSPKSYQEFALPYARKVFSAVTVPGVYYVNGCAGILGDMASVGAQCLSIDWRLNLGDAKQRLPHVVALQGNLDPYDLHLSPALIRQRTFDMCSSFGTGPGHIVNLGHGIVPSIPEDSVKIFIDSVGEWSAQNL